MRGGFYVTTALLITNSIRTAAESDHQQTSYHVGVVPGSMDTKSPSGRFLRGSREHHDDLGPSAADEERAPQASSRIIGNSLTSLSEEALGTMRKALHLSLDLNSPPEETLPGALDAYSSLRNQDPPPSTTNKPTTKKPRVSSSRPSKKRSLDEVSDSAIPKKLSKLRPKKPRTSASQGTAEVQRSISRDHRLSTLKNLSDDNIQIVHKLYLEHLERNSAGFKPTENETKKLLGFVNRRQNSKPNVSNVYGRDIEKLMKMNLKELKKLIFDSKPVLKPDLEELLQRPSKNYEEIQRCLLRLLSLKRLVRMYRDFFDFCLSNHAVCSNLDPKSMLQIELKVREIAKSGVIVASDSAVSGMETTSLTKAENTMLEDVVKAVKKANLSETDKKSIYKTVDEVYRDDDQLTPPDLAALIADASTSQTGKQPTVLHYDVLKTPGNFDSEENLLPGGQGDLSRDRNEVYEIVRVTTGRVKKTETRYDKSLNKNEKAQVAKIHKAFIKSSDPRYEPMLELTKKMWRIFNWKARSSPIASTKPGQFLLNVVCLMTPKEVKSGLGSARVKELRRAARKQPEADEEKFLLELKTDYLLRLLETYDKFYAFCKNKNSLCKMPRAEWLLTRRTKDSRSSIRLNQPRRAKNHLKAM